MRKTNDVLSEFAAKYLPALMTAYVNALVRERPMTMLNTISYTFVFFFDVFFIVTDTDTCYQILLCSISAYACGE